jgi:hypothetical protein
MKLFFSSLLCHRDVPVFVFTWFASRVHLSHGFDITHLILNDGSLAVEDMYVLKTLPNVIVEEEKVKIYPTAPNHILLSKLECFEVGFHKYGADRVVIIDPDIFIFKSWEHNLRKILMSDAICLRDWGSSIGPTPARYKELFGVVEDGITPNCNTGVYSIPSWQYDKIPPKIETHLKDPFVIMEDQGIFFASFYGEIKYITDIYCLVNGIEDFDYMWNWVLDNMTGAHLQGMRVRIKALQYLINHVIKTCPERFSLSQIKPSKSEINYGMLAFGSYDYTKPWQAFPTQWEGRYVLDGMYMHGGSWAEWRLPPQCKKFESKYICMNTGIPQNCQPIRINGQMFNLGDNIYVDVNGILKIETVYGEGAHIGFISPNLTVKLEPPALDRLINC